MKRTPGQRRADYRRWFWAGYEVWLARRALEDGCVGHLTRWLMAEQGHARAMYRAEVQYLRGKRNYARRRTRRGNG